MMIAGPAFTGYGEPHPHNDPTEDDNQSPNDVVSVPLPTQPMEPLR